MAPSSPRTPFHQRRSSRSSGPRRLSGVLAQSRPLSGELFHFDPRTAIDPHSPYLTVWHQVLLLVLLYECFLLPYAIAFVHSKGEASELPQLLEHNEFRVLYALESLFLVDFYVKLNTGFYEDGTVLQDASRSRVKYLTSVGFMLDTLAIVPLAVILRTDGVASPAWLEAHKMVRLWRLPAYFETLNDVYAKFFVTLKIVKVVAVTAFVTHVLTCVRAAFVSRPQEERDISWLQQYRSDSTESSSMTYVRAFFWTFGLLTGVYEGELPTQPAEVAFTVIVLLAGFSVFSYLCAVFSVLSKSEQTAQNAMAEARINQLKRLLCYYHVPESLQGQAVEYVKRYYTHSESNDREVVKLLCPSLAKDIQVELLRETVAKIPLFKGCSMQFITALTRLLEVVSLPSDHKLFAAGDPGECMYVVNSGILHIIVRDVIIRELRKGNFFGEVSVFSRRPRSATVITASYCTLYKLTRFNIERVLEGYPQYAEIIARAVETILNHHSVLSPTPSTAGPSPEGFLLTTLFQLSGDSNSSLTRAPPANGQAIATPANHRRKPSRHTRSTGPSGADLGGKGPIYVKRAEVTKRPQIARSKSAQNVSIARREQLSMLSRRSEREKTEGGPSEAGDYNDGRIDVERPPTHEEQLRSPTYVPPAAVMKRSQTFILGRKLPQTVGLPWLLQRGAKGDHRPSGAVDAMQGFYDNLSRLLVQGRDQRAQRPRWVSKIVLRKVIRLGSRFRLAWIFILQVVLLFNWISVPLQLGFVLIRDKVMASWYGQLTNTIADLFLWADLYVTANLEVVHIGDREERLMDTVETAQRYVLSRGFVLDVVCLLPYWLVVPGSSSSTHVWLRVPRLLRVWRFRGHRRELVNRRDESVVETQEQARNSVLLSWLRGRCLFLVDFATIVVGLFIGLHTVACIYFGLTQVEGFSSSSTLRGDETAWLPSAEYDPHLHPSLDVCTLVTAQYTRALFFSTTTLTTLGKTFKPESGTELLVAISCMALGLILSALLVDVVHSRFTSAALEQKEFLVTRARIQSFLRSQNAPPEIMQRVNAFLDFWWSSHRGAIASDLLQELPESIRREVVRAMCKPAVQTLSLLPDVRPVLAELEQVFVDSVHFILYGQGEIIYRQGDYASGLFFLLEGEVCMVTDGGVPRGIPKGGFFGTASLHLSESSVSYAERMAAISGCILLFVSREHLHAMHKTFPTLSMALKALEKRIIDSKLARAHAFDSRRASISPSANDRLRLASKLQRYSRLPNWLKKLLELDEDNPDILFDPDATSTTVWQNAVVVVIVMQSFKIIFEVCFGVDRIVLSETVTVLCEIIFLFDMLFNSRLGFYEYGNKIMDRAQMYRRYTWSSGFVLDAIGLIPLFIINWVIGGVSNGTVSRIELLNINKLVRLVRVTKTLAVMEIQHLNHTLELRLVKTVYYTMLLAHLLGCIWFSFGFASPGESGWLPDSHLQSTSGTHQYVAAVFWSFGVMTASATRTLPETPTQTVFSVVTMLSGMGLLAFIVGNLIDVVELRGADTRLYNAQLASLRHLLKHFALPTTLRDKLKTYVFFQRFHSITQEHLLEDCLPPSLLTDIRLVHLQPMIAKVAFLAGMEESVTRMLVSQFSQVLIVKDQYVCRHGEMGNDLFFVFTGIIEVLVPAASLHRLSSDSATNGGAIAAAAKENKPDTRKPSLLGSSTPPSSSSSLQEPIIMRKVNELTSGSYFGEIALFTSKPRSADARARTSSVLYKLSRRSLELVFERYPEWKKRVLKIVTIQQEQQHLRNLYMAEQQHHTAKREQRQEDEAKDPRTIPISRRMSDKLVEGSQRLVRGISKKLSEQSPTLPPPKLAHTQPTQSTRIAQVAPTSTCPQTDTTNPSTASQDPAPAGSDNLSGSSSQPAAPRLASAASVSSPPGFKAAQKTPVNDLWIDKLLECTEVQSSMHVLWLRVIVIATLFMALAVPYRIAFDRPFYIDENGLQVIMLLPRVTRVLEHVCELLFAWDIWMNWNLKESLSAMELYETPHRVAYQTQHRLLWDTLAAFPIDHFLSDFYDSPWLRVNRCIKVINFQHYVDEIYRRSVRYEQTRFVSRWLLFLIAMFWCASAYFVVAKATTASPMDTWHQWAPPMSLLSENMQQQQSPSHQLAMRLLRSFFFAVTAVVKKGKIFVPETESQLFFTLAVSFIGLLMMAIMIGEVVNLYSSYISNEVEFRHHHIAVKKYLERWRISPKLQDRAHAFLASLWSSHRGVNYQAILDDLPFEIRNDVVLHVAHKPLISFVSTYLSPLLPDGPAAKTELDAVVESIAQQLKYEGFPRDECIVAEGSITKEMYFVVKGMLVSRSSAEAVVTAALASSLNFAGLVEESTANAAPPTLPREVYLRHGDCFGERGLLGYAVSRNSVRSVRACDLLSLTSEALLEVLLSRPLFQIAVSITVESYREMANLLKQRCGQLDPDALDAAALLGISTPDEPWGDVLLSVVQRHQRKWQESWQAGRITAAQYNQMAPMRALKCPESCRRMFDKFLRLILPHGSLYARVASVRNNPTPSPDVSAESIGGAITTNDFHVNLPVMMSAASMHEGMGMSMMSTVSSSGSRDMYTSRRAHSRNRMNSTSLAAKMLRPSD